MGDQNQKIDGSQIDGSSIQQTQAAGDAVSFQNSHENRVTINNILLRLFDRPKESRVDWEWGERLLKVKQLPEICQRLQDTVGYDRRFMDISITEQPDRVNRSPLEVDRRLRVNGEDRGLLDPDKLLIETFGREDINGKLLILGAPGSGKTTALLSLAEQLVRGALERPKTVIPVIFELSTWRDDEQSIEKWLIEQLYDLHGGDRKRKIYETWLKQEVLLPLMDGLDELGLERQKKCTEKLNEFARHYPQLVICCRVKEFETVHIKLSNLRGAVCLQSLSDSQIENYLRSIDRADLWTEMQTNPDLQSLLEPTPEGDPGLLRVPLFINLAACVHDPDDPIRGKSDLLERYIERQLAFDKRSSDRRKGLEKRKWAYKTVKTEPMRQETCKILSWIARKLQANNTVELLIEKIQPSWLDSPRFKLRYQLICLLITMLIWNLINYLFVGLILGLVSRLSSGLIGGLIGGLFVGLIWGMFGFLNGNLILGLDEIELIESFQIFSFNESKQHFIYELPSKLIAGLISGLIGGLILGLIDALFVGLCVGEILGMILVMISTFRQDVKSRSYPNQGIYNSLQSTLWISIFLYLTFLLISVIFSIFNVWDRFSRYGPIKSYEWIHSIGRTFPEPLILGLIFALIFGLSLGGGLACVQHLALRILLWQSGAIPWNFARFLDYCVERRLLLRTGGHYRFLHRELLDHFAHSHPPSRRVG